MDTWASYLHRMSQGESVALSDLYDASSPLAYSVARRIVGDASDAEEVVLDAYLKIWKAAGRYDAARGSVKAWLVTIVRRGAIDRLRRRRDHFPLGSEHLPVWIDHKPSPQIQYELCERGVAVRQAMTDMPPKCRQALELAYYRGFTHVEIAEALDEPLGTVKSRVRSGLIKLRHCLSDLVYE